VNYAAHKSGSANAEGEVTSNRVQQPHAFSNESTLETISNAPIRSLEPNSGDAVQVDTEVGFFQSYYWTLNPFQTVGETLKVLDEEIARLQDTRNAWQFSELMTNVFLLSCALLNSIDDYVRGPTFRMPKRAMRVPFAKVTRSALSVLELAANIPRSALAESVLRWKRQWFAEFDVFLSFFVNAQTRPSDVAEHVACKLAPLLSQPLPADLLSQYTRIPSAFRKRDLTTHDVIALGRKFVARHPSRSQPILVVGLRTAGSYFSPLLRAYLKSEGYEVVDTVTIRPKKNLARWELSDLRRWARAGCLAILIDDPPHTGNTIGQCLEYTRKAGFGSDNTIVMFPVRPVDAGWSGQFDKAFPANQTIIFLEPEEWFKHRILAAETIEGRLREYYRERGFEKVAVAESAEADEYNARLKDLPDLRDGARLKRIVAVRLERRGGKPETRFVLAKSVGWGYFGYSAYLAALQLVEYVPPVLGLRDGILYAEWLPQAKIDETKFGLNGRWVERLSDYIARRATSLCLDVDPTPTLGLDPQHEGHRIAAKTLCRAFGYGVTGRLMNRRVREELSRRPSPFPAMIDGKISRSEWIVGPSGMLKSDFEHHGFGKDELNVSDPAYDLADAVLQFDLSALEERDLIRRYVEKSGDEHVSKRLFLNKLIAGIWSLESSLRGLNAKQRRWESELDKQYIQAWNFLTRESARFCGELCLRPKSLTWHSPLVVLDVDGVLDSRVFGFPTTTAAGIGALRCLHAHDVAVAINTARSAREVKEYCSAYGFVGGVAEYGSYIYDGTVDRGKGVASLEAMEQLEELRRALKRLSGVFLNDGYEHSIRAYTYTRNGMAALPDEVVPSLIARLHLDRLVSHQTRIDTTVVSNEVDKGKGLLALLSFVGRSHFETVAVGDTEHDVPMFRVAARSFAPGRIIRPDLIKAAGAQIARAPAQRGLLEIVRSLVHPDGSSCQNCPSHELHYPPHDKWFLNLLEAADKRRSVLLLRALLEPGAFQALFQS
jgi:hydroxymethylpyrimidine pyrophosphatase-like HAD family hydrolase